MCALAGLACPECGQAFDADRVQTICQECDSPLLACYDLPQVSRTVERDEISRRASGLWRWAELLPVGDPAWRLSLGEGDTPLLHAPGLGEELGLRWLFIKDEGCNPTGTFKARGLAVAVGRAAELGLRELVIPTAGNAGGALAAYAARGGLRAHVYMPADAPLANRVEVLAAGADLQLVDGLINLAGRLAAREARAKGWFDVSTFREPYRVEGKKTTGLEIAEALDWSLPEVIVYPTGGGTAIVGMWKAFDELEALGWIGGQRPRLACVQAAGCAPVVGALEKGAPRVEPWLEAATAAQGLRVPRPYADRLILRAVRESSGVGVAVSEAEIRQAQSDLAQREGILACLEGAAALAGLRRLIDTGWLKPDERVVLLNTGSGLKCLS